jgi:aarF domain-containing kinase
VIKHWPGFVSNLPADTPAEKRAWKESITVAHLLNHRSGLADAGSEVLAENPFKMTDYDTMVSKMEVAIPRHEPGSKVEYHFISFGWLVGGMIEKVAKRPIKELLDEMLGSMGVAPDFGMVGIPKGVEAKLASLHWDSTELMGVMSQLKKVGQTATGGGGLGTGRESPMKPPVSVDGNVDQDSFEVEEMMNEIKPKKSVQSIRSGATLPSSSSGEAPKSVMNPIELSRGDSKVSLNPMIANPTFFNHLKIRQSVIPAASGNFSARGLATFYSHLLSSSRNEPGFAFPALPTPEAGGDSKSSPKANSKAAGGSKFTIPKPAAATESGNRNSRDTDVTQINITMPKSQPQFFKSNIVDQIHSNFDLESLYKDDLKFTNGFHVYLFQGDDGLPLHAHGFGHSGMGGSFALAHPATGTALAVVINKISLLDASISKDIMKIVGQHIQGFGEPLAGRFGQVGEAGIGNEDVTMNPFRNLAAGGGN